MHLMPQCAIGLCCPERHHEAAEVAVENATGMVSPRLVGCSLTITERRRGAPARLMVCRAAALCRRTAGSASTGCTQASGRTSSRAFYPSANDCGCWVSRPPLAPCLAVRVAAEVPAAAFVRASAPDSGKCDPMDPRRPEVAGPATPPN